MQPSFIVLNGAGDISKSITWFRLDPGFHIIVPVATITAVVKKVFWHKYYTGRKIGFAQVCQGGKYDANISLHKFTPIA